MHLVDASTASSARPASSAATSRSRSAARSPRGSRGGGRGRRRLLRRRRRPGRDLRRVGQPRGALAAAGDPRLREQRLRRVHAALGAHDGRARQRRRRAVRPRAGDGRRQRRRRRARGLRARSSRRRARGGAVPPRVPDASARAATTRATRSATAQALAAEEWQELDPILRLQRRGSADGLARGGRPSGRGRRGESSCRVARESPFPPPRARSSELVYAS